MKAYIVLGIIAILVIVPQISESFGHGLGGDVAPPLDLEGRDVTVSTQLTPSDLSVQDASDASMTVRFYDVDTNETFKNVTYKIEIWQDKDLIARNLFFDKDGTLDVDLRTKSGCTESNLWKCTKYYGSEHPTAPGALYAQGQSNVIIQGPIFDRGGLYNVKVGVTAATSARTVLASPLNYDTFVSVADIQPFTIKTANAEIPAVIKTYYDKVSNIQFDTTRESLSFEMDFDWSPQYVELVQIVHEEIQVPKTFSAYSPDRGYAGYVDGVRVNNKILIIDPYTYDERTVIHFLVTKAELQRINEELGKSHEQSGIMRFELVPEDNIQKNTTEFYLVDSTDLQTRTGGTVTVSWDVNSTISNVPLVITFLDESGDLIRNARYDYIIADHTTNVELDRSAEGVDELGINALEGIDVINFDVPKSGSYRLDLFLYGQGRVGLDFDDAYAGIGSGILEFGATVPTTIPTPKPDTPNTDTAIPRWIKTTASAWAEGITSDVEFVTAIEFLIEQGVINASAEPESSTNNSRIPPWIRESAGWWTEGITSDVEFVDSLEFLIQKGIIVVEQS